MADINTIKNWFKTNLKPTQAQFWATWDSFWHKDEKIPVASVDQLQNYLDQKAERQGLEGHITNKDNPHNVTKKQLGLEFVDNTADVDKPISEPTQFYVDTLFTGITSHISDKSNPHNVSKTDVGLANVANYAIASDAESKEGTSNAKYMTPLRTKEAIESLQSQKRSLTDVNGVAVVATSNWNNYKATGWYIGQDLQNAPEPGWLYVTVSRHSTNQVVQYATLFESHITYVRVCHNGGWKSWNKILYEDDRPKFKVVKITSSYNDSHKNWNESALKCYTNTVLVFGVSCAFDGFNAIIEAIGNVTVEVRVYSVDGSITLSLANGKLIKNNSMASITYDGDGVFRLNGKTSTP